MITSSAPRPLLHDCALVPFSRDWGSGFRTHGTVGCGKTNAGPNQTLHKKTKKPNTHLRLGNLPSPENESHHQRNATLRHTTRTAVRGKSGRRNNESGAVGVEEGGPCLQEVGYHLLVFTRPAQSATIETAWVR